MEHLVTIVTAILPTLSGPGAAVVILVLLAAASIYIIYNKAFPMFQKIIDDHREDLKTILDEHKEDRKAFTEGMKNMSDGLIKIEFRMSSIEKAMQTVSDELDDFKRK